MIPHSRPCVGEAEAAAAARVVRSGRLAQGPEVDRLEARLAARLGTRHAVAVSSGTAALHLALLALGASGAEVVSPSYVCSAILHATRAAGAVPRLVDIDLASLNMPPGFVAAALNERTKAVVLPHMFGRVADLPELPPTVALVEDCAMALGAEAGGTPVGTVGALGAFSFYATKVICGAEGGALVTNDSELARELRDLRDYDGRAAGRVRFNYKMSDVHAAIARAQLDRLDDFVARRRSLGLLYTERLAETGATLPAFRPGDFPFRYVVRVRDAEAAIGAIEDGGVCARRPVHTPNHVSAGQPDSAFPGTAEAQRTAVSIPLYPDLRRAEVDAVLRATENAL